MNFLDRILISVKILLCLLVTSALLSCSVGAKDVKSEDNSTELPSIDEEKLAFILSDEIDGREITVTEKETLLAGQSYVLSLPTITSEIQWTLKSVPEGACTLEHDLDGSENHRMLSCASAAKAEITIDIQTSKGIKKALIKRTFASALNMTAAGQVLYNQNCQICHGLLPNTSVNGSSADQIVRAFSTVNLMNSPRFLTLTPIQIRAIAIAIGGSAPSVPTIPTTPTMTGPELYLNKCQTCHLPLASSNKSGRTSVQITSALQNVSLMQQPGLQSLTPAEIDLIALALVPPTPTPNPTPTPMPTPTVPTGAELYETNCLLCHSPLSISAKRGKSASQITNAIQYVGSMQLSFLQALSAEEITKIADALYVAPAPTPTPSPSPSPSPSPTPDVILIGDSTRGMNLYSTNCASCHSSLDNSQKKGRDANVIKSAIQSVGTMQSISALTGLTAQDLSDIAAALGVAAPVTPVTLNFSHIEQRLRLFQSPSRIATNDSVVDTAIKNYIYGGAEYMGGIFSVYEYKNHAQLPGLTFDGFETKFFGKMSAPASSLRRGYVTRSCEEIVFRDNLNANILAKRGLTTASPFNDANVKTIFQLFVPGREPSVQIITTLKTLGEQAKANSGQSLDGWRFILLSLCTSSAGDLL